MNKKVKALLLVLCALILVVGSVMGTFAYLTSKTDAITNTFSVGKVTITMDEAKVDEYGRKLYKTNTDGEFAITNDAGLGLADRVMTNTYKMVPGHKYTKDPTIHVTAGSENCYLFVDIRNDISGYEADPSIAAQLSANGWTYLENSATGKIYYKEADARASATNVDVKVFESFTILDTVEQNDTWNAIDPANTQITVTAYAVQADGFDDAADAWDNTFGAPSAP